MAPIDTSMYPTQQAQFNPLTQMQGYASLANTMQSNRLMQQEQQQRQLQLNNLLEKGKLVEQATDEYGNINQNKLTQLITHNKKTAPFAAETQQQFMAANPLTTVQGFDNSGNPTGPVSVPYSQAIGRNNPSQQAQPMFKTPQDAQEAYDHLDTMDNIASQVADHENPKVSDIHNAIADARVHENSKFQDSDIMGVYAAAPKDPQGNLIGGEPLKQAASQYRDQVRQAKSKIEQQYPVKKKESSQNPYDLSLGAPVGLAPGQAENIADAQKDYQTTLADAQSAPQEAAVLRNIQDISKSGALTGEKVGLLYQKLAAINPDWFPSSVTDQATQLGLIKGHISQEALSHGMPASDARLAALEGAGINDTQLPEVIQKMVPFLLGVNKARVSKANYYQSEDPTGRNAAKIRNAQSTWRNMGDTLPLAYEYDFLDPQARKAWVDEMRKVDPQRVVGISQKRKQLKAMGLLE